MILCKNLTKIYRDGGSGSEYVALDDVSFSIEKGGFVAVVGPSGCGKSTLLHILGCLDRPTQGSYQLSGQEVSHLSEKDLAQVRGRKIGFVFQAFHLLPRSSALHNVALPMIYSNVLKSQRIQKAQILLQEVGLEGKMKNTPLQLSGGERQRVAIARALANDPEVLLADEPTGNLDSKTGQEILSLFQKLSQTGKTILLVTHDREIAKAAGGLIQMKDGKIV
ncbi:MAG: ABC transporter ATP-binding protein [Elusimicrobia bacterium]|nr:ABC transporter ATP-binding protein [Elusimicrobiota bacterium]